ncbi:lycopene cyclase domain-containing protein [Jonesia quinghaiensis]|uniref:lycopene cyclase domain-containing protein n=1 Tax=Jonesia quinghaiensis TaxID=262806 RepID=UPI0003FC03F1|nr:lycopene cyclase domain-containing protein [Jonesia quinghaiensis]
MTYPVLALITVIVPAIIAAVAYQYAARRGAVPPRFWVAVTLSIIVLCVLTIIFDSLMIAADLFRYDENKLSGITIWYAPLEDLGWPIAAGLAGPCLLLALDARNSERHSPSPQEGTNDASPPPAEGPQ